VFFDGKKEFEVWMAKKNWDFLWQKKSLEF
jgi:hypothetical protein